MLYKKNYRAPSISKPLLQNAVQVRAMLDPQNAEPWMENANFHLMWLEKHITLAVLTTVQHLDFSHGALFWQMQTMTTLATKIQELMENQLLEYVKMLTLAQFHLDVRFRYLCGDFSHRWPGAGIWFLRYPCSLAMVWTLDPSRLYIPKGFGLSLITAGMCPF